MEYVYILINSEPIRLWDVAEKALKIKGVLRADAVTGDYDVIVLAELEDMSQLSKLIREVQSIQGVLRTHTCIVVPRFETYRGIL
ncbi:MAG: Lrp/AsnC ligand binding domain-containing protein [Candidatus Bathyarchaeia archaeon]